MKRTKQLLMYGQWEDALESGLYNLSFSQVDLDEIMGYSSERVRMRDGDYFGLDLGDAYYEIDDRFLESEWERGVDPYDLALCLYNAYLGTDEYCDGLDL